MPQVTSVGVGDGRVWVGASKGSPVSTRVSGEVVETGRLGSGNALQIAAGDGAVWATTFDSRAKRVEASSGRETAEYYAGGWLDPVVLAAVQSGSAARTACRRSTR